jgi:hypothetical protein
MSIQPCFSSDTVVNEPAPLKVTLCVKKRDIVVKVNCFILLSYFLFLSGNIMASENYPSFPEAALKGTVRTNLDSPEPTKEQLERKDKYTKLVESLNIPVSESLPVIEDSKSIKPRSTKEIAKRAIAVAVAAVKGEGMPYDEVMGIVKEWGITSYFSHEELAFINKINVTDQERLKYAWRYEGLDVLLWALGYKTDLPAPNQICNVKDDMGIIVNNKGILLIKNSKVRSINEILDMADYYYRLHWSAIELRLNDKSSESINEEIIMERHYALNWLIRYMDQEWDDISTDT